jgi:hypothetical protein
MGKSTPSYPTLPFMSKACSHFGPNTLSKSPGQNYWVPGLETVSFGSE